MYVPLFEGAAVAVLAAGTAIIVRWQPGLVAELYSRFIFHLVSLGMPREAREAWQHEAFNHLLEKIWEDMKTRVPEFVVLNAMAKANSLIWTAYPERVHYRNISSGSKSRLSAALDALREKPYVRLFSWRLWAVISVGSLLYFNAAGVLFGGLFILLDASGFRDDVVLAGMSVMATSVFFGYWLGASMGAFLRMRFGWFWRAFVPIPLTYTLLMGTWHIGVTLPLPMYIPHLTAYLTPMPYAGGVVILAATGMLLAAVSECFRSAARSMSAMPPGSLKSGG